MPTIINFHVFAPDGECLFSLDPSTTRNNDTKNLYGFLYTLKVFSQQMSPVMREPNDFYHYKTSQYTLVFYEFPTQIKLALIASNDLSGRDQEYLRKLLKQAFTTIILPYRTRCPMPLKDNELLRKDLREYLTANM